MKVRCEVACEKIEDHPLGGRVASFEPIGAVGVEDEYAFPMRVSLSTASVPLIERLRVGAVAYVTLELVEGEGDGYERFTV